jgi:hypothetical protein
MFNPAAILIGIIVKVIDICLDKFIASKKKPIRQKPSGQK